MTYVNKHPHIVLSAYFKEHLINYKTKPWHKYVNHSNEELVCEDGFDLLGKMLKIDHTERLTCKEAILHKYFDSVRDLPIGY